ncbi:relaxase domain-containing protein [bacterium]|nr:relaxase domain-containing protein [bacterium]
MLRIHKSYSGENATNYFNSALSKEGEYLVDHEIKSTWEGNTARKIGILGQEVTKEVFSNLAHSIYPVNKGKLNVRSVENARSGFDFTFSAVKSASILHAITKDDAIFEAHKKAYREAMIEIERAAQTQANNQNERIYQQTSNIIYAAFDHFTSRPSEIELDGKTLNIPDMQMHTHCFVFNTTWNEEKQRFQALETGNIFRQAPLFEAIYHSHFSFLLNEMGHKIERTSERYEISGVSREIRERFSNRTKLINEVIQKKGITDAKQKAELGARTRKAKSKNSVHEKELPDIWKSRLSKKEQETLYKVKNQPSAESKPITAKEAIDRSLEHHLERNSTVQEAKLLAYALKLGYGILLPDDIRAELRCRVSILRTDIDTVPYITTKEMVKAEDHMISMAVEGKGKFASLNPSYEIKQDFLNEQQRKAIKDILSSNDQVTLLKGAAGSGKTSLLTEVRQAIQESGKSLFAVAPSAQASRTVLRQKGFEADTVAALLTNPELHSKLYNNCLLVDEAGLLGVKHTSDILKLAQKNNCRVILSGDIRQHGPVEAGDAMRILEEKARLKTANVQKVVRQKNEDYRRVTELLARGKTLEGYQTLDLMDGVKEIPDHEERMEEMANDYIASRSNGRSALMISPTHYEGDILTQTVRNKLKKDGQIKGEERQLPTLKSLNFTNAQKQDMANYQEGQMLRFTKNQKGGFKAGSHHEILPTEKPNEWRIRDTSTGEIRPLPPSASDYFEVYQKTNTGIGEGDLIRMTANSQSLEGTKVNNGNTYSVKGFTEDGHIRLDNGKTLSKDISHFKHGYVETSYSSQGKDCQDVLISMSEMSFAASNEQQFYVSVSRGIHSARIYTSDKDELKKAIARSGNRMSATELAEHAKRRQLQIRQRDYNEMLNSKRNEHGRAQQQDKSPERDIRYHRPFERD